MLDLSCKELVELVTNYLEGALSPSDHARFEAHLETCTGCRIYLSQMRYTIRLSGHLTEQHLQTDMRDKLLVAFRAWKVTS
jgi:anti-sigma factor RsiW